jgi:hypothetical protein
MKKGGIGPRPSRIRLASQISARPSNGLFDVLDEHLAGHKEGTPGVIGCVPRIDSNGSSTAYSRAGVPGSLLTPSRPEIKTAGNERD